MVYESILSKYVRILVLKSLLVIPLVAVDVVLKVSVRYCFKMGANCCTSDGDMLKLTKKSKHILDAFVNCVLSPTETDGITFWAIAVKNVAVGVGYIEMSYGGKSINSPSAIILKINCLVETGSAFKYVSVSQPFIDPCL